MSDIQTTEGEIATKIAIIGLANAGKTSIVKVLTQEFDMLTSLRPTQSIERTQVDVLGKELIFWDYGGQDIYRSKYLATPERYFDSISNLYYVLDSRDPNLIDENISYFLDVYQNVKQYSPNAKYVILFHKCDPPCSDIIDLHKIKQKFLEAIVPALEADSVPITIYRTSIYNPLSIVTAFSQPLLSQNQLFSNISDMLKSFDDLYNLAFGMLFTKNFLKLGQSVSDMIPENEFNELISILMKRQIETSEEIIEIEAPEITDSKMLVANFVIHVGFNDLPFYLVIGYNNNAVFERDGLEIAMKRLCQNLEKILSNMDLFSLVP
jgi:GTPase SAR1 family protein